MSSPFSTNLAEHIGEDARFVHQGMTSSDVLDTCLSVQLVQATDILLVDLDRCSLRSKSAHMNSETRLPWVAAMESMRNQRPLA